MNRIAQLQEKVRNLQKRRTKHLEEIKEIDVKLNNLSRFIEALSIAKMRKDREHDSKKEVSGVV